MSPIDIVGFDPKDKLCDILQNHWEALSRDAKKIFSAKRKLGPLRQQILERRYPGIYVQRSDRRYILEEIIKKLFSSDYPIERELGEWLILFDFEQYNEDKEQAGGEIFDIKRSKQAICKFLSIALDAYFQVSDIHGDSSSALKQYIDNLTLEDLHSIANSGKFYRSSVRQVSDDRLVAFPLAKLALRRLDSGEDDAIRDIFKEFITFCSGRRYFDWMIWYFLDIPEVLLHALDQGDEKFKNMVFRIFYEWRGSRPIDEFVSRHETLRTGVLAYEKQTDPELLALRLRLRLREGALKRYLQ